MCCPMKVASCLFRRRRHSTSCANGVSGSFATLPTWFVFCRPAFKLGRQEHNYYTREIVLQRCKRQVNGAGSRACMVFPIMPRRYDSSAAWASPMMRLPPPL